MQIHELILKSFELEGQLSFYRDSLGMAIERIDENSFAVQTTENRIIFERTDLHEFYHFCFLIPTGALESAMDYIRSRDIGILNRDDEEIFHFENGRAFYFFDKDKNIVEFIERPLTEYPKKLSFSIEDVIKVNEIGLPVTNPKAHGKLLKRELGIEALDESSFSEHFAWLGDHHGVLILVKVGRHWLPKEIPAMANSFTITFSDRIESLRVRFEKDNWTLIE